MSASDTGEFDALPFTVRLADSLTAELGVNVTWIVQEALTARTNGNVDEQTPAPVLGTMAKSVLPVTWGTTAMLLTVSAVVVEVLVRVAVWAALAMPTCWVPKAPVAGATKAS